MMEWLQAFSAAYLALGFACAIALALDEWGNPQRMRIMNLVWPLASLFGTLGAVYLYYRFGRSGSGESPFWAMAAKGAGHCGAGCTLGDIVAEWSLFAFPGFAAVFGFGSIFGDKIFAAWALDYVLAFLFGVLFQYFTIAPMRDLGFWRGVWAAVRADALSLTAWQIGMYGWMACAHFYLFEHLLGMRLSTDTLEFWFMMQLAMLCGFAVSYPVNWMLIQTGIKERM
jgi:hypothetical protein